MEEPRPMEDPEHPISVFVNSLPILSSNDLDVHDSCPICLLSFDSVLEDDQDGVTKLPCAHIFCRKDILEWIRNLHGNCPTCRNSFLEIHPPNSDDESDGGEYMPSEDDGTDDGFMTSDFDMDLDSDDIWADEMQTSEGDNSMDDQEGEEVAVEVSVSITEDEEDDSEESDGIVAEEPK
ncbi:hypothetical protein FB45DRAFT_411429 [Roridomyces roridus]|uniref:RING-type domain-containing protein n=1 Tax=Roridomyces roridus TaxID=1738132 RepID=A0AAD7C6E1_9AGAR|nr:hypothetical protein FB45DRAFT_411429 [Roridomyces roridus]